MTTYVIRSMTTSDWNGRDPVVPRHIYLKPIEKRASAWWGGVWEAQTFASFEEAVAMRNKLFSDLKFGVPQVAPLKDKDVPPFWDASADFKAGGDLITNATDAVMVEDEPHRFSCEASDLGWKPGQWPERLETARGNGQPFLRTSKKMSADGEDLLYVRYWQALGCISLKVFND